MSHDAMKIVGAAVLYFLIVFGTGFVVGPVRVLFVEPRLAPVVAVLLEAPILLLAMVIGARTVMRWLKVTSLRALLGVGVVALVLQQCADVAVGVLLRGLSVGDHVRQFTAAPGLIYAALLIAFTLMPLAVRFRKGE